MPANQFHTDKAVGNVVQPADWNQIKNGVPPWQIEPATFVPVVTGQTGGTGVGFTTDHNISEYTKIGHWVFWTGGLEIATKGDYTGQIGFTSPVMANLLSGPSVSDPVGTAHVFRRDGVAMPAAYYICTINSSGMLRFVHENSSLLWSQLDTATTDYVFDYAIFYPAH